MSKAKLYKFISADGNIRASSFVGTQLLNHLRNLQQTSPTSTLALGRALIGTTLLASHLKDEQTLSMQINCDGPMRMVFAQASYEGSVRAYIAEPQLPMSVERGNLTLSPHVGKGTLTVSTYIKGTDRPRISQVLLQTGEITEDLAHYIRASQQIPCMLMTGVLLGSEGVVSGAGGILVELMPGHTSTDVERVESCMQVLGSLSQSLAPDVTGEDLLKIFFVGVPGKHWEHPHSVEIACSCSKEKVMDSIKLLGADEVQSMIEKQETVDVQCEMCGKRYRIDQATVRTIYQELRGLH
jgi:molecular chaperone Hsp33